MLRRSLVTGSSRRITPRLIWLAACAVAAVLQLSTGCSKKNSVVAEGTSTQSSTCTSACQHLGQISRNDAGVMSWCGRPFVATTKGADLTACIDKCGKPATPAATLSCADSADTCSEIDACGFVP